MNWELASSLFALVAFTLIGLDLWTGWSSYRSWRRSYIAVLTGYGIDEDDAADLAKSYWRGSPNFKDQGPVTAAYADYWELNDKGDL